MAQWRKVSLGNIRRLRSSDDDRAIRHFRPKEDCALLLSFIERLQSLNRLPPSNPKTQQLLKEYGVQSHATGRDSWFYEFVFQGARGERSPWLIVFFHIEPLRNVVRLCGFFEYGLRPKSRKRVIELISARVNELEHCLNA
jgi:hypothetical protein